jgi:hypothetical protein
MSAKKTGNHRDGLKKPRQVGFHRKKVSGVVAAGNRGSDVDAREANMLNKGSRHNKHHAGNRAAVKIRNPMLRSRDEDTAPNKSPMRDGEKRTTRDARFGNVTIWIAWRTDAVLLSGM